MENVGFVHVSSDVESHVQQLIFGFTSHAASLHISIYELMSRFQINIDIMPSVHPKLPLHPSLWRGAALAAGAVNGRSEALCVQA